MPSLAGCQIWPHDDLVSYYYLVFISGHGRCLMSYVSPVFRALPSLGPVD
jgi:hypothetical protein